MQREIGQVSVPVFQGTKGGGKTDVAMMLMSLTGGKGLHLSGGSSSSSTLDRLHFMAGIPVMVDDPKTKVDGNRNLVSPDLIHLLFQRQASSSVSKGSREPNCMAVYTCNDPIINPQAATNDATISRLFTFPCDEV